MSPLAALLDATLSPLVVVIALALEWWALWFTVGRSALPTLLLTLAANGSTLALAAFALATGAADADRWLEEPAAGAVAWIGAWLILLGANFLVEALVLRTLMRRRHPKWNWNPFDLLAFLAVNGLTLGIAAAGLWLGTRG